MFNLITILKRVKYQFYNLLNSEKSNPSNYKLFERRDTSYQHFINKFCQVSIEDEISLDEEIKIFGKSTDQYILTRDIFSNFDFENKKLKPAEVIKKILDASISTESKFWNYRCK